MEPNPRRNVSMNLEVSSFSHCDEGPTSFFCTHCDKPLEIHQPDAELPDRMLGTCDDCHVWYLVTTGIEEDLAVMIELPEASLYGSHRNGRRLSANGKQP